MSFSFKSVGHALSVGLHDVFTGMRAVESFIVRVDTPQNQAIVEGLTSLIPVYGPPAAVIERGVFAVAGEVAGILHKIDSNGESALLNAGFDASVIADFKALVASVPGLLKGITPSSIPGVPPPTPTTGAPPPPLVSGPGVGQSA